MNKTDELRTARIGSLLTPAVLAQEHPISPEVAATVTAARQRIARILTGEDPRLLVIIGPCSLHDPKAALDYAERLNVLRERYQDRLEIVMRAYFEKPRTVVGWKGLISDPDLDGSFDVNRGIAIARKLLLDINATGMPTATEFLDMVIGQFIADLISWGAIGARTTRVRSTVKWHRRCRARSDSKTVQTAMCKSQWMRFARHASVICSCLRINTVK
jgi:3-deoxy-D-arabinoheptulosonate-7-phosphate synthase (EC 2.5.1.54)